VARQLHHWPAQNGRIRSNSDRSLRRWP
jgi:hypothetical protein